MNKERLLQAGYLLVSLYLAFSGLLGNYSTLVGLLVTYGLYNLIALAVGLVCLLYISNEEIEQIKKETR